MSLSRYLRSSSAHHGLNDNNDRIGIAGFRLDARVSESEIFNQDIPTTTLEDGSFANDHIIRKPRTITIDGEIGGFVTGGLPTVDEIERTIPDIGTNKFYSQHSTDGQTAVNFTTEPTAKNPEKLFKNQNISSISAQQQFVAHMERLYKAKMLFTIDTERYGVLENMAIKSFSKKRDNTEDAIKYSLTAQQIEFAATTRSILKRNPAGSGTDSTVDAGAQIGSKVEKPQSLLSAIF